MKSIGRLAVAMLTGLIAVNIAGIAYYFNLNSQRLKVRPEPTLGEGDRMSALAGVDLQGRNWNAPDAPCHIIRITDDRCEYCAKDAPSYETIVEAARRAACGVVEISPHADGMAVDERQGVIQLKFVDGDIGGFLFPFVTPQTLVVDRSWSVRMTRRGAFDDPSLARMLTLLGTLSEPGARP